MRPESRSRRSDPSRASGRADGPVDLVEEVGDIRQEARPSACTSSGASYAPQRVRARTSHASRTILHVSTFCNLRCDDPAESCVVVARLLPFRAEGSGSLNTDVLDQSEAEPEGGGPHALSHYGPGSSLARSGRFAATSRKLFCAGLIAFASLAAAAPAAWGDDPLATAPSGGSQPPESPTGGSTDPTGGTGNAGNATPDQGSSTSTSTGSSSSSTDSTATTSPPPDPAPSSATSGATPPDQAAGDSSGQDAAGSSSGRSPDTTQQRAGTQEGAGSASSLDLAVSTGQQPSGPTTGAPGTVSPAAPAVTDVFDTLTGGSGVAGLLLTQPLGCSRLCYGPSASALGVPTLSHPRTSPFEQAITRSTRRVPALLPIGPGDGPGQFFNLFGGAGGSGAALVLLTIIALFGAKVVRALSWTKLRLPTAVWPPSAYVPPLESPG
jgi:hypothetical protein